MPTRSDHPHIYGAPDPENRQPPPDQGLRGEQGSPLEGRTDLAHTIETATGAKIEVEEQSGSAFAEVTGRAGTGAESENK